MITIFPISTRLDEQFESELEQNTENRANHRCCIKNIRELNLKIIYNTKTTNYSNHLLILSKLKYKSFKRLTFSIKEFEKTSVDSNTKKSFSNMITVIRLHLTSYVNINEFMKDTYQAWRLRNAPEIFSP